MPVTGTAAASLAHVDDRASDLGAVAAASNPPACREP